MISDAVQRYLDGRTSRTYRLRHAAGVLAAFALTLLALDADGLHTWATRMEVGPAQDFWLAMIEPWQRAAQAARLTAPRRLAVAGADWLADRFAATDRSSSLLARGWSDGRAKARPPPPAREVPAPPGPRAADDLATREEPAPAPLSGPLLAAEGEPTTVLLVGDSMMAAYLASAIAQGLAGDPQVRIVQAHREATGLARPDVFDWPSVVPDLLQAHQPRLIVCTFGGNDAQRVRASGGVLEYGGDAWDELYHGRVRAMMQALAGTDADVLWLGLPPMRATRYDRRMRHLNTIFADEARQLARVTFQETASAVGDESGEFAAYRRDPDGTLVRARMEDGVHYASGGAQAVAARVVGWVRAKLDERAEAAAGAHPHGPPAREGALRPSPRAARRPLPETSERATGRPP